MLDPTTDFSDESPTLVTPRERMRDLKVVRVRVTHAGGKHVIQDDGGLFDWVETSSSWLVQDWVTKRRRAYQDLGYRVEVEAPYL